VVGEYTYPREPFEYAPRIGIYRRLVERRVYKEGSSLESKTTYGKPSLVGGSGSNPTEAGFIVHQYNPATGGVIAAERHFYYGDPIFAAYNPTGVGYPDWREGKEFKTEALNEAGVLLRSVAQTWEDGPMTGGPRIIESVTTLADTNQVSRQAFGYDQYNNQTNGGITHAGSGNH
jgi:hypothetical protein